MYYPAIKIRADESVRALTRVTFPQYRGRKWCVKVEDKPMDVTSYWSGGSRSYFAAVNLATREVLRVPQNGTPFDGGPIRPGGIDVPSGYVIVEHMISCGKDLGIIFHVNPADMPKYLKGR